MRLGLLVHLDGEAADAQCVANLVDHHHLEKGLGFQATLLNYISSCAHVCVGAECVVSAARQQLFVIKVESLSPKAAVEHTRVCTLELTT